MKKIVLLTIPLILFTILALNVNMSKIKEINSDKRHLENLIGGYQQSLLNGNSSVLNIYADVRKTLDSNDKRFTTELLHIKRSDGDYLRVLINVNKKSSFPFLSYNYKIDEEIQLILNFEPIKMTEVISKVTTEEDLDFILGFVKNKIPTYVVSSADELQMNNVSFLPTEIFESNSGFNYSGPGGWSIILSDYNGDIKSLNEK